MDIDGSAFVPFDMIAMVQSQFWAGTFIFGGMVLAMGIKKIKGGPVLLAASALAAAEYYYQVSRYFL